MGKGPHFNSAEEKRLSPSKQVPFSWKEGKRAGAYLDPLSINLGTMD